MIIEIIVNNIKYSMRIIDNDTVQIIMKWMRKDSYGRFNLRNIDRINSKIIWEDRDKVTINNLNYFLPEEVKIYFDKVIKNMAFL